MTRDANRPPVLHSHSIPPSRTSDYMPPSPLGIPALARMANRSQARTIATYTEIEEAINRHLLTLTRQVQIKSAYLEANARAVGRAERLDDIRAIASLEIEQQLTILQKSAELSSKHYDVELARAEVQLKAARREADMLDRTPLPRPHSTRSHMDDLAAAFAEVREYEAAFDREIERIIKDGGGSEAELSEEARDRLDQVRMLKADRITAIFERL